MVKVHQMIKYPCKPRIFFETEVGMWVIYCWEHNLEHYHSGWRGCRADLISHHHENHIGASYTEALQATHEWWNRGKI